MKIEVDGSRCEGYGFCEQSAPELPQRRLNQLVRGLSSLPTTVTAA